MASRYFLFACVFILTLVLRGAYSRDGYLLTMPLVMRGDTWTQACMILYGTTPGEREVELTFSKVSAGEEWALFHEVFTIGRLRCVEFMVPPPGHYKVILSNRSGNLHDPVKVTVLVNKPMTVVQTDKPAYKPGEKENIDEKITKKKAKNVDNCTHGSRLVLKFCNACTIKTWGVDGLKPEITLFWTGYVYKNQTIIT
ncbi:histone-lysine N-methyltransferase SETMAR [Plakobranchus ocellatus]|uniref:Histone-lysine N-methyltransferase SETMAR n=1 Tax=Plakobranchus ocellatus TaxID=259542 RepID=A0AAV3ZF86_9GAST|nr:histone-lysine N-methyltransferase SETMAR [Plakobranchus ocellatus]